METFHFINEIENTLGNDIYSRYIIRNEKNNYYIAFKSPDEIDTYVSTNFLDGLHEVIFGSQPQRLKVDIDCSDMNINESTLLDTTIHAVKSALFTIWQVICSDDALIVTSSSKEGYKYSFHILTRIYIVKDNINANIFTQALIDHMPPDYVKFIDRSINKSIQNFRLLGSAKFGSDRIKKSMNEVLKPSDALISIHDTFPFIKLSNKCQIISTSHNMSETLPINDILSYLDTLGLTRGFKYNKIVNNAMLFTRQYPTFCNICKKTHDNDNTLMIMLHVTSSRINIIEYCRHHTDSINHGNIPCPNAIADDRYIEKKEIALSQSILSIKSQFVSKPLNLYQSDIHDKHESNTLKPFPKHNTLLVKAAMKMGKTKTLHQYIKDHFSGVLTNKVLIVSFRQTFSNSIAAAFKDFSLYNDIKGDINLVLYPRLIIQVESLHRIQMISHMDPPDLVVLDESESIFHQFNSGLHKYFNASFAAFAWLIAHALHIICMDANLGDRTINLIREYRKKPILLYENTYKNASNDTYYLTTNQGRWKAHVMRELYNGKKICIPTNSLTDAKTLHQSIKTLFPKLNIGLYNSETLASVKKEHFSDVNKYWIYDVLIFTPTCSAGVSFEMSHYDIVAGSFVSESCDVETCRQMIGRIRHVKENKFIILIQAVHMKLQTNRDAIHQAIHEQRSNLYKNVDMIFEYDNNAQIILPNSKYWHCWLENKIHENKSRNCFDGRFIAQTLLTHANVMMLESAGDSLELKLIEEHNMSKYIVKQGECNAIANANNINYIMAIDIQNKMRDYIDVTLDEMYSHKKYMIRQLYDIEYSDITAEFVSRYMNCKSIYLNLVTIYEHYHYGDPDDMTILSYEQSLDSLKIVEKLNYESNKQLRLTDGDNSNFDIVDIRTEYMYTKHILAYYIITLCGWHHPLDTKPIHEDILESNFKESSAKILALKRKCDSQLELRKATIKSVSDDTYVKSVITFMNTILRHMYSIAIKKQRNSGTYKLSNESNFIIAERCMMPPNGIKNGTIHIMDLIAKNNKS